MGYAIFTARKLMLTNRINQLNFRRIQLSQQQQTLAQASGDLQRYLAGTKNMFNNLVQNFMNIFQSNLNQQIQNIYQTPQGENNQLSQAQINQINLLQQSSYNQMQQIVGSIFMFNQGLDLQTSTKLGQINQVETQIELEAKTIETQIKALTAERDAIEKEEDNQIKNSAPKFA